MSAKCQQCLPANDCQFPSDLEIYGLQGPNGPWSWITSGALYYGGGARGGWRNGGGGSGGGGSGGGGSVSAPSNAPGVPYNPPSTAYSKAQSACNSCTSLSTFCYTAKFGLFRKSGPAAYFPAMQAQVDAAALAYAKSKVAGFGKGNCIKNPATDGLRSIPLCLGEDIGGADSVFTAPANFSGTGLAKCTWVVEGALPGGISFKDNGNGTSQLTGTANEVGLFTFIVKAMSSGGDTYSTVKATVSVLSFLTLSPMPAGNVCSDYYLQLTANGGIPPYTFAINTQVPGFLPYGLNLISGGRIVGKPTTVQTTNFVLVVTDSLRQQCTKPFSLTIGAPTSMPSFTTGQGLPNGHSGYPYFQFIGLIGGCPPYALTITLGSLPFTFKLAPPPGAGDWAIAGNPGPAQVNSYSFTIQAVDSAGQTISQAFALTIDADVVVTGSCANGQLISASGSSPQLGGYSPTMNSQLTNAAAIKNLISNLQTAGCTCPPLTVTVDPVANDVTFTNIGSCLIQMTNNGPACNAVNVGPGLSFNYRTCYHNNTGAYPNGQLINFNIGGTVVFTFQY